MNNHKYHIITTIIGTILMCWFVFMIAIPNIKQYIDFKKNDNSFDLVLIAVADDWCPYNCDPKYDKRGYIIDILQYIYVTKLGYNFKYKYLPWEKAIESIKNGDSQILVGASIKEVPGVIYPNVEAGYSQFGIFARKSDLGVYNLTDLTTLDDRCLGIISGYDYGPVLMNYIEKNKDDPKKIKIFNSTDASQLMYYALLNKEIDLAIDDIVVWKYRYNQFKEDGSDIDIRLAYKEHEVIPIYVAFSPKYKEALTLAKYWDYYMIELRASGKLDYILDKYGLKDWRNFKITGDPSVF